MKVCFYPPFKTGFMMQARLVWVSPSAPHLPKCRANKRCATPHPMRFSILYPTTRAEEFHTPQGSRYKGFTSHQFRPNLQDIGITTLRKPNTTHLNNLKHRKHRRMLYTHTQSADSSFQRSSLHVLERMEGKDQQQICGCTYQDKITITSRTLPRMSKLPTPQYNSHSTKSTKCLDQKKQQLSPGTEENMLDSCCLSLYQG